MIPEGNVENVLQHAVKPITSPRHHSYSTLKGRSVVPLSRIFLGIPGHFTSSPFSGSIEIQIRHLQNPVTYGFLFPN